MVVSKRSAFIFHLFVSCVLFVFMFAIRSLLVCYSTCPLSRHIFAFEDIIYKNVKFKTSLSDASMKNPEKGRK